MKNYIKSFSPGDMTGPNNSLYKKSQNMGDMEGPKLPSIVAEGSAGSIEWYLYSDELLKIQGKGIITHDIWRSIYDKIRDPLIRHIHIEEGITAIGNTVFRFSEAKTISLPSTLTHIGVMAFERCRFEEITIPAGVVSIEISAFDGCKNLKEVMMPERFNKNLVYIGFNIFSPLESYRSFESYFGIPKRIVTFY